jgi:hypothetical protein
MVKQKFLALDDEEDSVGKENDVSQDTSNPQSTIWSKIQQFHLPHSLMALFLITTAVTLFGLSNFNSKPSEQSLMSNGGDWDLSPYRFDFLIQSPYQQTPSPYSKIFIPLYVTHPLSEPHPEVTSVVISIHGYTRNAGVSSPRHLLTSARAVFQGCSGCCQCRPSCSCHLTLFCKGDNLWFVLGGQASWLQFCFPPLEYFGMDERSPCHSFSLPPSALC